MHRLRLILVFLAIGLTCPICLLAEKHHVTIDQTSYQAADFGTTILGIGNQTVETGIWPCNFWSNFNLIDIAADLDVLKLEGGNSVILLYPFISATETPGMSKTRREHLQDILELADKRAIRVTLRLGYAWDNGYSNAAKQRQTQILTDQRLRQEWYEFCNQTYAIASKHQSFAGAFICWEDYWAFLAGAELNETERKAWAEHVHYPHAIIPARRTLEMEEFFDFFNDLFALDFFPETQKRFPQLGMEVRLDYDPIYDQDKFIKFYVHKKQFAAPGLKNVYLYWGPFMGALNQGDLISADLAVHLLEVALERALLLSSPEANLIISQFNYRDNTPGFSQNSRIDPAQMDDFIRKCSPLLRNYCTGVFTWSNHSYHHNAINNGTFSSGPAFWEFNHALAGIDGGRISVSVFPGGSISQHIEPNSAISAGLVGSQSFQVEFSTKVSSAATCVVTLDQQTQTIILKPDGAWNRQSVTFSNAVVAGRKLSLSFPQGAHVDDVVIANHTQLMGPQDPAFNRDSAYAYLAWILGEKPETAAKPVAVSGVTPDNWIISRATFTAPTNNGAYQITLNLTVPPAIHDQTVSISLQGSNAEPKSLNLAPGDHELVITGYATTPSVRLVLAFSRRQVPVANGPDQRELAAYLSSISS